MLQRGLIFNHDQVAGRNLFDVFLGVPAQLQIYLKDSQVHSLFYP
jgi:hypothetical protein